MSWLVSQAAVLLASIVYHTLSLIVLTPFLLLARLWISLPGWAVPQDWQRATHWRGTVLHSRSHPVQHKFEYEVRTALVEIDDPPIWFAAQAKDHLTAEEARQLAATDGKVLLLTNPISAGYLQNPISVYFCYDGAAELQWCIAEVTNTPWAERVRFLFHPNGTQLPKALHVSPMMGMSHEWALSCGDPGSDEASWSVAVNAIHPRHGLYFQASIVLRKCEQPHHPNELAALPIALQFAFEPHRIALWIYWQALILLQKGVPFYPPPGLEFQKKVAMCPLRQGMQKLPGGAIFEWHPARGWPWT